MVVVARVEVPVTLNVPVLAVFAKLVVPVKVGALANTAAPVPVSSLSAVRRFAEVKVPREVVFPTEVMAPVRLAFVVTVPAVRPAAVPVMLVPTKVEGVPRFGVTKVGAFEKTTFPVPVSSERRAANCAEVVKALERPRDEVAICDQVFPALPMRSWFWVMVERPVPPLVAARVPVVSDRAIPRVLVATVETVPLLAINKPLIAPIDKEETDVVANVDVPATLKLPVAVMVSPKKLVPCTVKRAGGVVVPIPTLPALVIRIRSSEFVPRISGCATP
jgi:hypothetical protein